MSQERPDDGTLVALSRAATTARLLSGVIHEINNALLVISGSIELVGTRNDLPEPVARAVDRIGRQTARTAAAIAAVTAFTQAGPGGRAEVELEPVTQASVELRRFAIKRAGLSIEDQTNASPKVLGNRGELQQMILNLIIHAEQALASAPPPEPRGRIQVVLGSQGINATLRVIHSLPLPPGSDEDLFNPFPARRPVSDTSGLGLFAARAIAAAHGGSLTCEADGAGTALVVNLPVEADR